MVEEQQHSDYDEDGLAFFEDNCPFIYNPDQNDTDNDGVGNACDNAPLIYNPDQGDLDNDGVSDVVDNAPTVPNPDQADSDADGIGDVVDPCDDVRVTVYYNFDSWNDYPGAGDHADDLSSVSGELVHDSQLDSMVFFFNNTVNAPNGAARTQDFTTDLTSTDSYTIMFWIKMDPQMQFDGGFNNNLRLVSVHNKNEAGLPASTPPDWQVEGIALNDPNMHFQLVTNYTYGTEVDAVDNLWHHVAFQVSNEGAFRRSYMDGVLQRERLIPQNNGTRYGNTDGFLWVGGAKQRSASGYMDDFALFENVLPEQHIIDISQGLYDPYTICQPRTDL